MNNQTIYVTGEARTTIDNAITKMFGTFYIAFEIILLTDEIINMDCNATLRLTRDFIKRIFLNHNIIKDDLKEKRWKMNRDSYANKKPAEILKDIFQEK